MWLSTGGADWDQVGFLEGPVRTLVANENGYLAQTRDRVWFSSDGLTWSSVPDVGAVFTVGAGPGGFVAIGSRAWWSPDGERWRNIGSFDDLGGLIAYAGADSTAVIITGGDNRGRGQLVVGTTD